MGSCSDIYVVQSAFQSKPTEPLWFYTLSNQTKRFQKENQNLSVKFDKPMIKVYLIFVSDHPLCGLKFAPIKSRLPFFFCPDSCLLSFCPAAVSSKDVRAKSTVQWFCLIIFTGGQLIHNESFVNTLRNTLLSH